MEGNLFIRTVIGKRDENGLPSYEKTYDLNDSLIEIYFSDNRGEQQKEWHYTLSDPYGRMENYHMVNNKVVFRSAEIYNNRGRRLQSSYVTQNLSSSDFDEGYTFYGCDTDGNLICRIDQGEHGWMSVERWYRKNGKLIRYTKDNDLTDDSLNEEKRYDEYGNMIFLKHVSRGMRPVSEYELRWTVSTRGLYLRREEYSSGKLWSIYRYAYK